MRRFLALLAAIALALVGASTAEARIQVYPNKPALPGPRYRPPGPNPSASYQFPAGVVVPPFYLRKGGEVWVYKNHHFYPAFPRHFLKEYQRRTK